MSDECRFCDDGVCSGCGGDGVHPLAGQGSPANRDYIPSGTRCSWCEGNGKCSADETHWRAPAVTE